MDRDDRLVDPMQIPRSHALGQRGGLDLAELDRRLLALERYNDRAPQDAMVIGWPAPTTTNQTITTTTYTIVTGSTFELSFAGTEDATWIVTLMYRVVIASTGAADDDAYARILIDWGDGTFRGPDIDLVTAHGQVTAFGPEAYGESAATGTGFSLYAPAVLKVRGGSSIRVAVAVQMGSGSTSVTVALSSSSLAPHCVGTAIPYRRVR